MVSVNSSCETKAVMNTMILHEDILQDRSNKCEEFASPMYHSFFWNT